MVYYIVYFKYREKINCNMIYYIVYLKYIEKIKYNIIYYILYFNYIFDFFYFLKNNSKYELSNLM
jgi:hypothetical protein